MVAENQKQKTELAGLDRFFSWEKLADGNP
jgi:hypothetical protein